MRLSVTTTALKARAQHPGWWSAALAMALFPLLFMFLAPGPHSFRGFLALGLIALVAVFGLFLSPIPWQWTADDRPLASWWRGFLQALFLALVLDLLASPVGWIAGKGSLDETFRQGEFLGLAFLFLVLLGPAGIIAARAEHLALEAREAQAKARDTQWMSHRGAFSPRLLFNSLNHLASLAGKDSPSAEQGLVDLAALYRRWLLEAELPLVPLSTDRSLTEQ